MSFDIDAISPVEAVIVATRTFDAPRDKVWVALTTPEHVKRWYGGAGFSNPVCEMDVRVGGLWHHVMRTPDGFEIELDMVFVAVEAPEKLVWQHVDFRKPSHGLPPSENTVTLEARGAQTVWRMVARFASFEDRERACAMGFGETLGEGCDRFDDVVQAL